MSKIIRINGTDYSTYLTKVGYVVGYRHITGDNAGYMLDGTYTDDIMATKAVLTITCLPLTDEQQAKLMAELYSSDYLTVYYYDPKAQAYRNATMRLSDVDQTYLGAGTTGTDYWRTTSIQLTER